MTLTLIWSDAMDVTLIEPDGTENMIVTQEYAIDYCAQNSGWSWRLRDHVDEVMGNMEYEDGWQEYIEEQ